MNKRFEHDGEVVPDRHQRLSAQAVGENVRHSDGKGGRAAGAVVERLLAYGLRQRMHFGGGNGESPVADGRGGGLWRLADDSRRTVDREVDSRLQHASGDHRHNGHHGFSQHGTVSHHAGFGLAPDQLGRRAARDQRVKAADGAACNRDEREGKNISRQTPGPSRQ